MCCKTQFQRQPCFGTDDASSIPVLLLVGAGRSHAMFRRLAKEAGTNGGAAIAHAGWVPVAGNFSHFEAGHQALTFI